MSFGPRTETRLDRKFPVCRQGPHRELRIRTRARLQTCLMLVVLMCVSTAYVSVASRPLRVVEDGSFVLLAPFLALLPCHLSWDPSSLLEGHRMSLIFQNCGCLLEPNHMDFFEISSVTLGLSCQPHSFPPSAALTKKRNTRTSLVERRGSPLKEIRSFPCSGFLIREGPLKGERKKKKRVGQLCPTAPYQAANRTKTPQPVHSFLAGSASPHIKAAWGLKITCTKKLFEKPNSIHQRGPTYIQGSTCAPLCGAVS
ncbi:hypothetical protein B0T13DRAFT_40742 [Neurospora crassa]|nr:hypothetical protein B0T13DRAFT_40742 [Neurospora crassa]